MRKTLLFAAQLVLSWCALRVIISPSSWEISININSRSQREEKGIVNGGHLAPYYIISVWVISRERAGHKKGRTFYAENVEKNIERVDDVFFSSRLRTK